MKRLLFTFLTFAIGVGAVFADQPIRRKCGPSGKPISNELKQGVRIPKTAADPFIVKTAVKPENVVSTTLSDAMAIQRLPQRVSPRSKKPMRITRNGANIYGLLVYDYEGKDIPGIYEMESDGSYRLITPVPTAGVIGQTFVIGHFYVRDGHIIVTGQENQDDLIYFGAETWAYNLFTRQSAWTMHGLEPSFQLAAYDPANDLLMGYYKIEGENHLKYGTAPGDQPSTITMITDFGKNTPLPYCAMTYNIDEKKLVAVKGSGQGSDVVKIDPATGEVVETEAEIKVQNGSKYVTGLTYSPVDKAYYYAYCNEYWDVQGFDLLDPSTFQPTFSTEYDRMLEWQQFVCTDLKGYAVGAPDGTEFVSADFGNGDTSGSVTFRLPSKNRENTQIMGKIEWILEIDGREVRRGTGNAGAELKLEINDMREGLHGFNLRTLIAGKEGRSCMRSIYIGHDIPKAPETVTLTFDKITWTAVTDGANDGYVDPAEITYDVYMGDTLLKSDLKDTSCDTGFSADQPLDVYYAVVIAKYKGKQSAPTYSYMDAYGTYKELPWSMMPQYMQFPMFTVVNKNGGSQIYYATDITLDNETISGFYYEYDPDQDADDYLFLPPTKFDDANAMYDFCVALFRFGSYTECYEIVLAKESDPDKIVKVIKPQTYLDNGSPEYHTDYLEHIYFTVPEPGVYTVGIHVTSPADMYRVVMTDFSLSQPAGMNLLSPDMPASVTAKAFGGGELKATVTATLPTLTMTGKTIPENAELTLTVQAGSQTPVSVKGKPGETVSADIVTVQGDNDVILHADNGDAVGRTAHVTVFTGIDIPGAPDGMTMVTDEDGLGFHLEWKAPSVGARGGYVDPTGITYYVCQPNDYGLGDIVEVGKDVFSYDIRLADYAGQNKYRFGVFAENSTGRSEYVAVCEAMGGKPLDMPYKNNYKAGEQTPPIVVYDDRITMSMGTPGWMWSQFETPDNPAALVSMFNKWPEVILTDMRFSLPTFSTVDQKCPAVGLEIFGGCVENFTVYASTYGVDPEPIATYARDYFTTRDITEVIIDLPEKFRNRKRVEVLIGFDTADDQDHFILYQWRFFDNIENDFGVGVLQGLSKASVGEESRYTARVVNYGRSSGLFPGAVWKLTSADGDLIASMEVPASTGNVATGEVLTFPIAFTPSAENLGEFTVSFALSGSDENAANDRREMKVIVDTGNVPVITDLHAKEITSDNVVLEWEPLKVGGVRTESFEKEEPFIIDSEAQDEYIAGFRRIDRDGAITTGPGPTHYYELPSAFKPASFVVVDSKRLAEALESDEYDTPAGDKFLLAMCPDEYYYGDPADDWLISPEVTGGTEISFIARPWTNIYGNDKIEILYSSTGNDPDDFQLLEEVEIDGGGSQPMQWQEYKYVLPGNAKYFAIRYVSIGTFGLLLDNIAYTPVNADITLAGYDIYRDGVMLAGKELCDDGTYNDATVKGETDYAYELVPVLSDGSYGMVSNRLLVRTSGLGAITTGIGSIYVSDRKIVVKGYDGRGIVVATADGRVSGSVVHASSIETFPVNSGIFVVKAGNDVVKLIVK